MIHRYAYPVVTEHPRAGTEATTKGTNEPPKQVAPPAQNSPPGLPKTSRAA
jgi:hypothetical protein